MTTHTQMIFVNLPVKDLERSKAFYEALGYPINPTYTNGDAACHVISEQIYLMILVEKFFQTFTSKPVADAHASAAVINALSAESREAVDAQLEKALKAGGTEPQPPRDYGFMYQRSFQDPDGHLWELAHMDGTPG
jgi:uncharacterized protein